MAVATVTRVSNREASISDERRAMNWQLRDVISDLKLEGVDRESLGRVAVEYVAYTLDVELNKDTEAALKVLARAVYSNGLDVIEYVRNRPATKVVDAGVKNAIKFVFAYKAGDNVKFYCCKK